MATGQRASRGIPLPYLRAWREHRAMAQADLSAASGVSRQIISRFEHDPTRNASYLTIGRLAKALGISAEEMARLSPTERIAEPMHPHTRAA